MKPVVVNAVLFDSLKDFGCTKRFLVPCCITSLETLSTKQLNLTYLEENTSRLPTRLWNCKYLQPPHTLSSARHGAY